MNNVDDILKYEKFGIKLGLENIKKVLEYLQNPQENIPTIHIAGTNGKGSTAAMIESGLIAANYKVLKYSSPYLEKLQEMYLLNNEFVADELLITAHNQLRNAMEKTNINLTLYEVTTANCFLIAKSLKVDYLILEVGLGGRYDATNVCNPRLSIITNVSLDHTNILGTTKKAIAKEKAGIIRSTVPLYTAEIDPEILDIFSKKAGTIKQVTEDVPVKIDWENKVTKITIDNHSYVLNLIGYHQRDNFLLAYHALKACGVENYLIKKAMLNIKHPARMEIISSDPLIIFDGAHNVAAAKSLVKTLKTTKLKPHFIFGALNDKDIGSVLNELSKISIDFTFIPTNTKGRELKKVDYMKYQTKLNLNANYQDDINGALQELKKVKLIVICGTLSNYKTLGVENGD